ncbi:hypothetical protein B9K24_19640, partial [Salmonella enterica]|nr:hypothetical protein [Salmonella enterica]
QISHGIIGELSWFPHETQILRFVVPERNFFRIRLAMNTFLTSDISFFIFINNYLIPEIQTAPDTNKLHYRGNLRR